MGTARNNKKKSEVGVMPDDRLSIYKEQYYFELQRKDHLGKELTLPVGVITLLIGAESYFTGKIDSLHPSVPHAIYGVLLILISLSIARAIYFLIRSNYGHIYEYFPTSRQTENYYRQLETYCEENGKKSDIEPSFVKYLIDTYNKCNERNTMNNDKKSAYIHNARTAIISAIIFSAMTVFACNIETTEKVFHAILK